MRVAAFLVPRYVLYIFFEFKGAKDLTRGFIAAEFKDNASFDVLKARSEWFEYNNQYQQFARACWPLRYRFKAVTTKRVRLWVAVCLLRHSLIFLCSLLITSLGSRM